MRHFLVILFISFILQAKGQAFVTYKDTINKFSINIPVDWKYGINKSYPDMVLLGYRIPSSKTDTSRDNFNIHKIKENKTLEESFADVLFNLTELKDYKLVENGEKSFNGSKFKFLIQTHTNDYAPLKMYNYDFVGVKNGTTYILTMVTQSFAFDRLKPVFDQIAASFVLLD